MSEEWRGGVIVWVVERMTVGDRAIMMAVFANMEYKARAVIASQDIPLQALSNSRYRSSTPSSSAKLLRSRMVAAMLLRDFDQGVLVM